MKLYGTTTSPYVRRVRIFATELGIPFEFISTSKPEGEAELRRHTPVWKVPTAIFNENGTERVLWDSHTILDYLTEKHGWGPFRPATVGDPWHERNLIQAIEGAMDSAIFIFQMERDGIMPGSTAYLTKQGERLGSTLKWVESQLRGNNAFFEDGRLGLAELLLLTTLDWLVFRNRYPVANQPRLVAFQRTHAERPSVKQTYPVVS
jgi:glutathione S-transferase